jgi:hypothetical protein
MQRALRTHCRRHPVMRGRTRALPGIVEERTAIKPVSGVCGLKWRAGKRTPIRPSRRPARADHMPSYASGLRYPIGIF